MARRLHLLLAVLLALCALALSGCHDADTEQASADGPRRGGELVLGLYQEPGILNPWLAQGGMAINTALADPLRDPLIEYDENRTWQPAMIERVPTLENGDVTVGTGGMRIRFALRAGLTWSDGEPIECDDWRFTWQTMIDPKVQALNRIAWRQVSEVICHSARKVEMRLHAPYAPYLAELLGQSPLPQHALAGKDFNRVWNDGMSVSSGPYVFSEWKRGVRMVYTRNPNYWRQGGGPYIDKLVFKFVRDANTLKIRLRSGEVDMVALPPDTNQQQELDAIDGVQHVSSKGAAWEQLAFQVQDGPLADPNVRAAVAYAIDRSAITDIVLKGQVEPLDSTIPEHLGSFRRNAFERYRPSRTKVQQHMRAAGYELVGGVWSKGGAPLSLRFVSTSGNPVRIKIGELLQEQLRRAGFGMTLTYQRSDVLFSQVVAKGFYDMGIWAWSASADPTQSYIFACDQVPVAPTWQGKNDSRYCSRRADALLARVDGTIDVDERTRHVHALQEQLAHDLPLLPLYQPPDTVAYSNNLQGYVHNPVAGVMWNIDDWWVKP